MKTKRTLFLMTLAVLLSVAVIGASYVETNTVSYQVMAQNEGWDAQIDKAIEQWGEAQGPYSYVSVEVTPEAFRTIYELGPEAALYILDRVERSGENGGEAAFLVGAAKENLHHRADVAIGDETNPHLNGTPQYYAYNLRAFLETVPEQVESICGSFDTQEEKLEKLNELGLAALPYITARIERGETQWTPYLETQLLGMTAEERFEALKNEVVLAKDDRIDSLYAYRQQIARPVDAAQWIAVNADTLSVLKDVTD